MPLLASASFLGISDMRCILYDSMNMQTQYAFVISVVDTHNVSTESLESL